MNSTNEGNLLKFKGRLGSGLFADVYQAQFQGEKVAVKVIDLRKTSLTYQRVCLRDDAEALRSLEHINLIEYQELLQRKTKIYVIMKMVNGGNLWQMMQRRNLMEEFEAKVYFRQIAEAIAYLHENEIAHGDVRLENIMWYPAYNIKMTAFSFTKRIGDCDKSKNRMLPHDYSYWMPEMLKGEEYDPMMADNWAAGVVVFTLINGCFPFDDKNRDAMLEAQQQQQFKNKHHVASGVFKDLLHEIFEPDIKERSTMAISLSHRWLKPVPNYAVEMLLTPRIKSAQFDKCDGDEEEGDDDMNSRVRSPIICS